MKLITGHSGEAHITAADDGAFNAIVYTDGKFVFDTGKKFAIEKLNDNSVRIYDGYAMNQGRKLGIEKDDYEELVLENGMQNKKRADLIVIRYEKNIATGIESAELTVITGPSGSEYEDPQTLQGNIVAGDIEDDMPLYRIRFNGLEMEGIDPLFDIFNKQLSSEDYTSEEKEKLKNIDQNANNYVHPATAGNKHIPTGGAAGQVLKYGGSSGEASWGNSSYYGTCQTAAATVAKTVSLSGFSLFTGATVAVMFSNGNTATNPTLNVNDTGAKAIHYLNSALTSSTAGIISKNGVYLFVYSGSNWQLVGNIGNITISEMEKSCTTLWSGIICNESGSSVSFYVPKKYWHNDNLTLMIDCVKYQSASFVSPPNSKTVMATVTRKRDIYVVVDNVAVLNTYSASYDNGKVNKFEICENFSIDGETTMDIMVDAESLVTTDYAKVTVRKADSSPYVITDIYAVMPQEQEG